MPQAFWSPWSSRVWGGVGRKADKPQVLPMLEAAVTEKLPGASSWPPLEGDMSSDCWQPEAAGAPLLFSGLRKPAGKCPSPNLPEHEGTTRVTSHPEGRCVCVVYAPAYGVCSCE